MAISNYKELIVWQKAMDLVAQVYRLTERFPKAEQFGLVNQLRRAAVSVPSNIAEGQGRASAGEFKQFLGHARGSLYEVETQCLIAANLGFIVNEDSRAVGNCIEEVGRLINGLSKSLTSH